MKSGLIHSLRAYKLKWLKYDLIAGVLVAALTIPIAMGYAQVAGLPPVYGLYASILPTIAYALFTSSPQMVFGMDASASAITGSSIIALGYAANSLETLAFVPLLALFTAAFLFLFAALHLGKLVGYISKPVMSGFISGLAVSIMLGQIPKMLSLDTSGVVATFKNIASFNPLALAMALAAVAASILGKRFCPKVPMALVLLVLGTFATWLLRLDTMGIIIVGEIPKGFPPISFPNLLQPNTGRAIGMGFMLAIVIFADSLLSTTSFAVRNKYQIRSNRELLAFGCSNLAASLSGCPPTSASVSRAAASEQYHGRTQLVSLFSAGAITLIVVFFSDLLFFMPQPVLSGIVFAAMLSVVDTGTLKNLISVSRVEAGIWFISAVGVLVFDVLIGVLIGVILSFIHVIYNLSVPQQAFLGIVDGRDGYFDLAKNKEAHAIPDVIIYRFSARLFFANIDTFKKAVSDALTLSPKALIIDARGINSIDSTAAEELLLLIGHIDASGIRYYFAEHTSALHEELLDKGLGCIIEGGHEAKTIGEALKKSTITAS